MSFSLGTEELGVGHNDVIWDYDIIIMTSELMMPIMIPFPAIIYEPILIPSILTWSLHDVRVCVCVCHEVTSMSTSMRIVSI